MAGQEGDDDRRRVARPCQTGPQPGTGLEGDLGEVQAGGQAHGRAGVRPAQPHQVVGGEHERRGAHQGPQVRHRDPPQEQVGEDPEDEELEAGRHQQGWYHREQVPGQAERRQHRRHEVGEVGRSCAVVRVPHGQVAVAQLVPVPVQPGLHLDDGVGEEGVAELVAGGDGAHEGRSLQQVGGGVGAARAQRRPEEHDKEHAEDPDCGQQLERGRRHSGRDGGAGCNRLCRKDLSGGRIVERSSQSAAC